MKQTPTGHNSEMESPSIAAAAAVIATVVSQECWQSFGFRAAPVNPPWWLNLIDPGRALERRMLQRELWGAALAEVCRWARGQTDGEWSSEFLALSLELTIDGLEFSPWKTLGFKSRSQALLFVRRVCQEYLESDQARRAEVFERRCVHLLNCKLPARWRAGVDWLFHCGSSPVVGLAAMLDGALEVESELRHRDAVYLELARRVLDMPAAQASPSGNGASAVLESSA